MIATPDHWHTKIAAEAMRAGKDVYCEKPLTLTIAEGKLLEDVVNETGRVLQVGTMQRTESEQRFLKAIALIRDGRIGTVKKITCGIGGAEASPVIPAIDVPDGLDWDMWLGPAPEAEYRALPELRKGYGGGVPRFTNCHYAWRNWYEYSGGQMNDWGAHHVDIATWALNAAGAEDFGPSKITPVSYDLPVPYENGYPTVEDRYNSPTTLRGAGRDARRRAADDHQRGRQRHPVRGDGRPVLRQPRQARRQTGGGPGKPPAARRRRRGGLRRGGQREPHRQLRGGDERSRERPVSDVFSHNRMLEICHLANIAIRLGRELEWNPATRQIVGDPEANAFLSRESREGYGIEA